MNSVCLSGTLGKEVQIVEIQDGVRVLNNTIKVIRPRSDKFDWINVVCYEETAEYFAENFRQNDYVVIQGTLKTRSWIVGEERRYLTEVLVWQIEKG